MQVRRTKFQRRGGSQVRVDGVFDRVIVRISSIDKDCNG